MHVHFTRMGFSELTDAFYSLLDPNITVTEGKEISQSADFDILVHPTPSEEWIKASPYLRTVVVPWAGIPEKLREVMENFPDINVHNLHHNNYNTAELGFALLLSVAKHIIPLDKALRKNDWTPRYEKPKAILLRGRTALILGFGEIGQALADYCLGFGMKVLATRKHTDHSHIVKNIKIFPDDHLHQLLPSANVLFIALPLTTETRNLIGETELSLLPKGSILINIGRGDIVNQKALYESLVSDHLGGAGSDVWYNYPKSVEERKNTPPADVPFDKFDNFVLSPHRGGMIDNVDQQRMEALACLLNAANRGEEIPNKVDLNAGY